MVIFMLQLRSLLAIEKYIDKTDRDLKQKKLPHPERKPTCGWYDLLCTLKISF